MGFDQEPQRAQTTQAQVDQTQDKPGKTTRVDPQQPQERPEQPKPEGDARLEQLIAQLEKQFVRNPEAARQTAVTLSVEFPDRFDAAWVLRIYEQIKDAVWRKDKIATVNAAWDDRPGVAKAAIAELRARYRGDKQLARWASAMIRQIDQHQTRLRLEADVHAWDRRPSPAQAAARELNRLWPRNYPKSWLVQIEKQIWQFQDVKWAAKISDAELTAALGENAIDWNEAPDVVKQELQIQLGRKKADLYYGKGGRGAKDDRALVLTDASRSEVLAKSEAVTPKDSPFTGWTKKEDIPVKRLEVVGRQYDKKADELLKEQIPQQPQSTNPLIKDRPDVFTTLYNQSLVKQAEEYRQRGAQYQALVANIRSGATSIDAERKKIERDLAAIDWALRNQLPQLRAYEQEKEKGGSVDDKIAETRAYIEQLEKHEAVLKQVMSDPQGVIPGAGSVSAVLPTGPSMQAPDAATIQASRQVAQVTDTIQAWTGGENPEGIQKNFQEMAIGLTRLKGRFDMMSAGIYRMVGNLGSYVLPDSITGPILGMADQMRALGMAFTTANTKFTKDGEAIQMKYVAEGGTIPMIDRVFSTQKIFEKPDVAILSFLQAMPQTKGVSLALQVGINAAQTIEAFFSTYGRTGQLTPAIQAAGWSAVQGTIGIVLDKLGVPPGAQLVANITMIYGFGKMRGLSNDQIQEEIAYALVASAVGAGTGATKRGSLTGIGGKSREIVTAIEDGNGKQTLEEAPRMDISEEGLAKSQRIDDAANELATAIETQRAMMREMQALQQAKQPTKQKLVEIEQSIKTVEQKRTAMATALGDARTVGTSQIKITTTEATPTPVKAETAETTPQAESTPQAQTDMPGTIDAKTLQLTPSGAVGKNNAGVYTTVVDGVPAFVKVLKAADAAGANEIAITQKLGDAGIGPRLLGTTTIEGRPAIITEAIADGVQIDRNTLMISPDAAAYAGLGAEGRAKIVAEIERIAKVVETAGVEVGDLQFLYSRTTGKLYVIDPGQFHLLPAGKTAPLARVEVETFARNLKQHWSKATSTTTPTTPMTTPDVVAYSQGYRFATPGDRMARAKIDLRDLLPTQASVQRKKVESKLAQLDEALENPNAIRVIETEDGKLYILDGHHTVEAAKRAGKTTVEVQVLTLEQVQRLTFFDESKLGRFQKLEVVEEFVDDN